MSTAEEQHKKAQEDAVCLNTIKAPLDRIQFSEYVATFHTFIPSRLLFFSYGANVGGEYWFNGNEATKKDFSLQPNGHEYVDVPSGTKRIDVGITNYRIAAGDPDPLGFCLSFSHTPVS